MGLSTSGEPAFGQLGGSGGEEQTFCRRVAAALATPQLREFADPPPYAILSHRWTDDELAFKDYHKLHDLDTAGANKVKKFCAFLREIYNTPPGPIEDFETRHPILGPRDDEPFDASNIDRWVDDQAPISSLDVEAPRVEYKYYEPLYESGDVDTETGLPQHQAVSNGPAIKWAWVDTCCIDKASSSELSEAINSMWLWYRRAELCVAYLSDVQQFSNRLFSNTAVRSPTLEPVEPQNDNDQETCNTADSGTDTFLQTEVRHSEWFSRGWTLQELLAPDEVIFCNQYWHAIGRKKETNFCTIIEAASGVPLRHLMEPSTISHASVAQRMSWASHRVTTRDEDMGYCLSGLFSVNMPLIYGEGRRSFLRLQEEIIQRSDDESILAWTRPSSYTPMHLVDVSNLEPLIAAHPRDFKHSQDIYRIDVIPRQPYSITNKGLQFVADAIYIEFCGIYVVQLNCAEGQIATAPDNETFAERCRLEAAASNTTPCMIALKKVRNGSFARVDCNKMDLSSLECRKGFTSALQETGCYSVDNKHFLLETREAEGDWIRAQDGPVVTGGKIQYLVGDPPSRISQWLFGGTKETTSYS
ncbi:hypothetical protein PRZ48_004402 [Zasmidium cellare]|uniref:Heterokaryon incompatibility domain-containing protein n=1 Tax=Zasmidium cellare TaxID=395010 RepID=A0ABR0EPP7_ZASCE|nr:hypothetical protein PRZ48_004402 [Zasmidium cellare]